MVRVWILTLVLLNAGGWLLSACGQLNAVGYAVLLVAGAGGIFGVLRIEDCGLRNPDRATATGQRRAKGGRGRLRIAEWGLRNGKLGSGWFPMLFAVVAGMALLGGILHPPNSGDSLQYRIPRMLEWWWHGGWFWIPALDARVNTRASGSEWVAMPLLIFTRSDRWLFLPSWVSLLMMPGLIYSLFIQLQVPRRVAWAWMWILPTGYIYVTQAGSTQNDVYGVPLALGSVVFALQAREKLGKSRGKWERREEKIDGGREVDSGDEGKPGERTDPGAWLDAALAFFCICLLTSAKSSNLPLILPGLVALASVVGLWLKSVWGRDGMVAQRTRDRQMGSGRRGNGRRWIGVGILAGVGAIGVLASFVPTAVLNARYAGEWTGYHAEGRVFMATDPVVATAGNSFMIAVQNLAPPIMPFAMAWNRHALQLFPAGFRAKLLANMEEGFWEVREIVAEERAGLGFGIAVLLIVSLAAGCFFWRANRSREGSRAYWWSSPRAKWAGHRSPWMTALLWSPYVSLAAYMAKCGVNAGARLISPYYVLLFPALLRMGNQAWVVRQRWWHRAALGVFALALVVLITIPGRPLWPAQTVLKWGHLHWPNNGTIARAQDVYGVFARRNDGMGPLRRYLPRGTRKIGAISYLPDAITAMWKPFGSRSVEYVIPGDTRESLAARGIEYVVVRNDLVPRFFGKSLERWLESVGGEVIGRETLHLYVWDAGEREWSVVRVGKENKN